MNLLIVESPTKAKTISKFLGKDFQILASMGHVRDLPKISLGIDVNKNYTPHYVIADKHQEVVTRLKEAAKKSEKIIFATDEDREGEAIAWHLANLLNVDPASPCRISFHEITESAIKESLKNLRSIDLNLVNAQQARRILDRLVGYELSPFLWRKVSRGLSAGRVQSVAVRLIVEREREIMNFKPQEYWTIEGKFSKKETKMTEIKKDETFVAKLNKINGKILEKFDIKTEKEAKKIISDLKNALYFVKKIEKKKTTHTPPPPFTTSLLQQEANKKLGFSSKQTMLIAQQLYEGIELGEEGSVGLITYMRTDSANLSENFLKDAENFLEKELGKNYHEKRIYKTKTRLAQEAHEAIRPTNVFQTPDKIKKYLNENQYKLYNLIWRRALASQMPAAQYDTVTVDIEAQFPKKRNSNLYEFRAVGSSILFDGFLKIYPLTQKSEKEKTLPLLEEKEELKLKNLKENQHFTEPPARFSDATLVKTLEEYGIGRPSTYAPIISTIIERGYITRLPDKKLAPNEIAFVVNDLLVKHFPDIVDYNFTAKMENNLDEIAKGEKEWIPVVDEFYKPFKANLSKKEKEISKKDIAEKATQEKCPKCGSAMIEKIGRFGRFLACSAFPKCKYVASLNSKKTEQKPEPTDEICEKCGSKMYKLQGKYGPYLRCSKFPECKFTKKILVSLGIKCPQCKEGELVEKKSRKGTKFWCCSRYPECNYALWNEPVKKENSNEVATCPKCGSVLVYDRKRNIKCYNKNCDFELKNKKE
jgi:DNA topoisomerase-1